MNRIDIRDFGGVEGGVHVCTGAIQAAINEAELCGGEVYIPCGVWLTGSLFLKSNMGMYLEEGAVLLGISLEDAYPITRTRVAGIEMDWPAGILNIMEASHVYIKGKGTIDGQGEFWWEKYWGKDRHGGMRRLYEEQGLRWAVDYDCFRARNVIVYKSKNVSLECFHSKRSGFWNIHACYSEHIVIRNIKVSDNEGPSTDGIDIDSCRHVLVENCRISCNDDNICIKSGRDADGLRVNRPCEDVIIKNCTLLEGEGITIGSETSGGVCGIRILNNIFKGTRNGLRIKSAKTRGGVVEDVLVEDMEMTDVRYPFTFQFNWYPAYSYCKIPENYIGKIPEYWVILTEEVSKGKGIPHAKDLHIKNVQVHLSGERNVESEAFDIKGLEEAPFENFVFENVKIQAKKFGTITGIHNLKFKKVEVDLI